MQFYKIVRQTGSYNGKTSDTGIYKLINVQTYDQLDMFFNSIDEAIKYCNKNGYTAISPKYSLDQEFNLQNIQKYIIEMKFKGKPMQKQNLSKSQVKLKKLLTPIVEGILNEENDIIKKTINLIKNQIGLNLKLDDYFSGIRQHNGKRYFNVVFSQRIPESNEFSKLEAFAQKYKLIKIEPNGLYRCAIFPINV